MGKVASPRKKGFWADRTEVVESKEEASNVECRRKNCLFLPAQKKKNKQRGNCLYFCEPLTKVAGSVFPPHQNEPPLYRAATYGQLGQPINRGDSQIPNIQQNNNTEKYILK